MKGVLKKRGYNTAVGDEGGFAPSVKSNVEAIEVVLEAITQAGYKPGEEIAIALDPAASEFYQDGKVRLQEVRQVVEDFRGNGEVLGEVGARLSHRLDRRRLGRRRLGRLGAADQGTWRANSAGRRRSVRHQRRVVCSDGIDKGVANSILIKVNQIGSVSETLDAIDLARRNGYTSVISHRSGETEDTFIADLAVATGAGQIKTGSASRTDRIAKYNQLLRIEEELGAAARFLGLKALNYRGGKQRGDLD